MKKLAVIVIALVLVILGIATYKNNDKQAQKGQNQTTTTVVDHSGDNITPTKSAYQTECNPKPVAIGKTKDEQKLLDAQKQQQQQEIINIAEQMQSYNNKPQGAELQALNAQYYSLLGKYDDCVTKPVN